MRGELSDTGAEGGEGEGRGGERGEGRGGRRERGGEGREERGREGRGGERGEVRGVEGRGVTHILGLLHGGQQHAQNFSGSCVHVLVLVSHQPH